MTFIIRDVVGLRIFFFQAEDGIRDGRVTGVQTCALPISSQGKDYEIKDKEAVEISLPKIEGSELITDVKDRKSTRLNSSHPSNSYAVFCLKKKNNNIEYYI